MSLMSIDFSESSKKELTDLVAKAPERIMNRVGKHAAKKAGQAMAARLRTLVPMRKATKGRVRTETNRRVRGAGAIGSRANQRQSNDDVKNQKRAHHAKDSVAFVSRSYQKGTVVYIPVGYETKKVPHQHLIEHGNPLTRPRRTKHKSQYKRSVVGTIRRKEKYTKSTGQVRTRYVNVAKTARRSIGSFATSPNDQGQSRGNMPAIKPITRAAESMKGIVSSIISDELRKGLERALQK